MNNEMKRNPTPPNNEPKTPTPPPKGQARLGANADEARGGAKAAPGASIGQIPIVSKAVAKRQVKSAEKKVGQFLTDATASAAKATIACAKQAEVKALLVAARESVRRLSEDVKKPLVDRLDQAEQRLDKEIPGVCVVNPTPAKEGKTKGSN